MEQNNQFVCDSLGITPTQIKKKSISKQLNYCIIYKLNSVINYTCQIKNKPITSKNFVLNTRNYKIMSLASYSTLIIQSREAITTEQETDLNPQAPYRVIFTPFEEPTRPKLNLN